MRGAQLLSEMFAAIFAAPMFGAAAEP